MSKTNQKITEKQLPLFQPKVKKIVQPKISTYNLKNGSKLTLKNESFNSIHNQLKLF
jgi:hypothetical protein